MAQRKRSSKPIQIALTEDQISRIIQEAARTRRSLKVESLEDRIAPSRFGLPVFGGADAGLDPNAPPPPPDFTPPEGPDGSFVPPESPDPGFVPPESPDPGFVPPEGPDGSFVPPGPLPPDGGTNLDPLNAGGGSGGSDPLLAPHGPDPLGAGGGTGGGDPVFAPHGPDPLGAGGNVPGPGSFFQGDPATMPGAGHLNPNAVDYQHKLQLMMQQRMDELNQGGLGDGGEPITQEELAEHRRNILRNLRGWNG